MRLSDVKTGGKAVITRVLGYGGFRKRIIEMGFLPGKEVDVILNAPLDDPIKYKVVGYEVSLRRKEAELIEVVLPEEYLGKSDNLDLTPIYTDENDNNSNKITQNIIHVALVGNPNSGKTSLFNIASKSNEHVGNYGGVTIESKEGFFTHKGYKIKIVDLPGTYSLSAYSPEELYVRKHIVEKSPDIIINVLDSSNLERNLYLTTQLIDMNIPVVAALNMYDELEQDGGELDYDFLGNLLGIPMIPTICKRKFGIDSLFDTVVNIYKGENEKSLRHIHINYGRYIEKGIGKLRTVILKNEDLKYKYHTRYLALKLIEGDEDIISLCKEQYNSEEIMQVREKVVSEIEDINRTDAEAIVVDAKYGFINGALAETLKESSKQKHIGTSKIDTILVHKIWGFPIFFLFMFIIFWATFNIGGYPMEWIESGVGKLGEYIGEYMTDGMFKDMLIDGVLGGVGGVIVFLPNILILYFFISIMEDSGYMSRAAFIMDKLMHKIGLHGKSFIPLLMGFGCNVPAIMATRTIENRKNRLVTMLVNPLMSCSARLPVYIFFIGTFFAEHRGLMLFGMYFIGILLVIVLSKIFNKILGTKDDTPFVMELPPYRFPTSKAIFRHSWSKGKQYLKKMGGVILVASIIIWALGYFPLSSQNLSEQEHQENSYIGRIGKTVEPVIKPLGFDWKLGIGLVTGVAAKEIVLSTLYVIYPEKDHKDEKISQGDKNNPRIPISPLTAFTYMVFTLVYFPCIATFAAIKNESGSWKWAIFSATYSTVLAWILSFLIHNLGQLII